MENQTFLPSVPSCLSTITTITTAPSDTGSEASTARASPVTMFDEPRFYIGDGSQGSSTDIYASVQQQRPTITMVNIQDPVQPAEKEECEDLTNSLSALMGESTKRMAGQNSFDSGYGIIVGVSNGGRFVSCDSNAAIVLNQEADPEFGGKDADSGLDESISSGSYTNGTFGKTRIFSVVSQVFLAIMLSSAGNFGAGIILDNSQKWTVFHRVPELFYLVPALLGLKGNLEMTMVARLSTMANMGQLNTWKRTLRCMVINISLVQCQAIVISFLASSVTFLASIYENNGATVDVTAGHMLVQPSTAMPMGSTVAGVTTPASVWIETTDNGVVVDVTADAWTKVLVIFSTSLATANAACLGSSIFMILMIVLLTNYKINPDNFATAIAASIGDIVTSYLLGVIGQFIFNQTVYLPETATTDLSIRFFQDLRSPYCAIAVIIFFVILFPALAYITCGDKSTKKVLFGAGAWCPILVAMMVSFVSGAFLRIGAKYFAFMALFQPLINGVGGNLAAITTSRLSTEMHIKTNTSSINGHKCERRSITSTIAATIRSFLNPKDSQNALTIIFVVISILIQLVYGFFLPVQNGHFGQISALFYALYCLAATVQVLILLIMTRFLVNIFWYRGMDPDTCAIPLLTSMGDLLGTLFLLCVFYMLRSIGDISAMPAESEDAALVSSAMAASIGPSSISGVIYTTVSSLANPVQIVTSTLASVGPVTSTVASSTIATVAGQVIKQAVNMS